MENREIENLFSQLMSPDHSEMQAPDPLLVFEARQAVLSRRKRVSLWPARFASIVGPLFATLRMQHLGVAVLLLTSGLLYVTELTDSPNTDQSSAYDGSSLITASNTTISVISSTMLTSIPTLRN